ncbi:YitT family protein [Lacticaseibacillus brantae]|uniref:Integral inner membrane protein n=1 Tax=Lacticaseibacillus brantae DSM 23927 TaxID=1423727 RepID=A0A0R2AZE3_9LACO|nr:YitT family protein [Lacticaseibacillus brantae]KRM72689.1 integral inner membrane protein [Lacticaseibacillus brantae DSM 23927]
MKLTAYSANDTVKKIGVAILSGLLSAIALNFFLIPAKVFSAGLNGVSQLMSLLLQHSFNIGDSTGWFILLFNLPLVILAWFKLGHEFTIFTSLTSLSISVLAVVLPVETLSTNPLMNAIFGGVLTGIGVGIAMRYGFSTGGMDIISLVLSKTTGRSVGTLLFATNLLVILAAGLAVQWESAMYTIISIYCMTRLVDTIHTSHQKITAMIVTTHKDDVIKAISDELIRGITVVDSKGGFTGASNTTLLVVITRFELYNLTQATLSVDPGAFINIMNTIDVVGEFLTNDQQAARKQLQQSASKKSPDE